MHAIDLIRHRLWCIVPAHVLRTVLVHIARAGFNCIGVSHVVAGHAVMCCRCQAFGSSLSSLNHTPRTPILPHPLPCFTSAHGRSTVSASGGALRQRGGRRGHSGLEGVAFETPFSRTSPRLRPDRCWTRCARAVCVRVGCDCWPRVGLVRLPLNSQVVLSKRAGSHNMSGESAGGAVRFTPPLIRHR